MWNMEFLYFLGLSMGLFKNEVDGHLGGSVTEPLPWAQVVIPGSGIVPRREPASPSAFLSASLCVSLMNK